MTTQHEERPGVTVVIPVGPEPQHVRWLDEAIASVREQTYPVGQILLIDDMQGMPYRSGVTTWHAPWHLGVATAFNIGVALAAHELVFMLGSDDRLLPTCISQCIRAYKHVAGRDHTYFSVPVQYSDEREDQNAPCNAAMVTKALWRRCGGFPIEASTGAPDAALISIMMKNPDAGRYVMVGDGKPLYWYRVHDDTDTAGRGPWQGVILGTRDLMTQLWHEPRWSRLQRKDGERPEGVQKQEVSEGVSIDA